MESKNNQKSEISLSQEWVALSEALYGEEFIVELANFLKKHRVKTILECGCGSGHILKGLEKYGFSGLGIDSDREMINLAKSKYASANVKFRKLNWLNLEVINKKFDAVICRGNSLSYFKSWKISADFFNVDLSHEQDLLEESLNKMFNKVKNNGLLFVDTVSQSEINKANSKIEFANSNINLKGKIIYNWQKRTRIMWGLGLVNGKEFNGGSVSYSIRPKDLTKQISKLNPKKVWHSKFKYENNYYIICAEK